ncbi:MAG: ATP synthase F1 subunit delta [Mariprofundales bacterium]
MSTESRIARRYARALFELIDDGDAALRQPLAALTQASELDEMADFLALSTIPAASKKALLTSIVKELPAELDRFLTILADRNKLTLIATIGNQIEEMIQANAAEVDVELIVATRIPAALRNKIAAALETRVGKKLNFEVRQHKAIIGGFVINIGDRRIDHSVRTRLGGLRAAIAN